MTLDAEISHALAQVHLENLRLYAAKARECRLVGRDDLAAVFRTYALHAGRQWLALIGAPAHLATPGDGKTAYARRALAAAHAANRPVVTNVPE